MRDMQAVISEINFFHYILTSKFYNTFQSQPNYEFDTVFFEICWLWRQPNIPSKYYKILPVHTERPYHAAYAKFQIDIQVLNASTTFGIGNKILLYPKKSVTVPPCCNFAINWWYRQLHVGGKNIVMEPPAEFLHLLYSSYFIIKGLVSLHSASCNKPPTSECTQYFLLYTATYVSYN